MKSHLTFITVALLGLSAFSSQAATELSPLQAAQIVPFKTINFSGSFSALNEINAAASRRADKLGADSFYVTNKSSGNALSNWNLTVALYHKDAPKVEKKAVTYREFSGVKAYDKTTAAHFIPFDEIQLRGQFAVQASVNDAVGRAAAKKGAYAFVIADQSQFGNGSQQTITAYLYKKNAAMRDVQAINVIPADSESGKKAIAAGGELAKQVERVDAANIDTLTKPNEKKKNNKRYTVTTKDGVTVQEVNKMTALQMTPFKTISFTAQFHSITQASEMTAKKAAAQGAKYYHIVSRIASGRGDSDTITAELFK